MSFVWIVICGPLLLTALGSIFMPRFCYYICTIGGGAEVGVVRLIKLPFWSSSHLPYLAAICTNWSIVAKVSPLIIVWPCCYLCSLLWVSFKRHQYSTHRFLGWASCELRSSSFPKSSRSSLPDATVVCAFLNLISNYLSWFARWSPAPGISWF